MYKELLMTAREAAEMRFKEKGLDTPRRRRSEEADDEMLGGLMPKRATEEVDVDDFMTKAFTRVYAENRSMAEQIQSELAGVSDGPTPEAFSSAVPLDSSGDVGTRLKQDIQEIFGLEDYQAAGIVGNFAHETGDFQFMQEIKPMVPGSRGGWGFAQWTGPRRKEFEGWAEENSLDPASYEANLGFFVHEVQTDPYFGEIMGRVQETSDVDQAARVFSDGYLKPGIPKMDSRLQKSRSYLGQ